MEEKKDRPHSNSKNKKKTSVQFNFPKIKLLERENFSEFDIDETDILFVNRTMDEHEFYLNMANNHINNASRKETKIVKTKINKILFLATLDTLSSLQTGSI